jgi:hypothetical protein
LDYVAKAMSGGGYLLSLPPVSFERNNMRIETPHTVTLVPQAHLDAGIRDLAQCRKENPARRVSKGGLEARVTGVWDPRCYFASVLKNGFEATRHDKALREDGMKKGAGYVPAVVSDRTVMPMLSERGRANFDEIDFSRRS